MIYLRCQGALTHRHPRQYPGITAIFIAATAAYPTQTSKQKSHPLGGSGTKLMTTLIHGLHEYGKRYGLQTMCEGGGMANVTIIERL